MMSELIQIPKPLEEATRELSTEQRVSCSKVIPLLNALLFELRKNVVDDDETLTPDDDETQVPESLALKKASKLFLHQLNGDG